MTRQEHLEWCKERAREYLNQGDIANAVTSMLSDMDKHPETELKSSGSVLTMLGMQAVMNHDQAAASRFIEGFN